MKLLKIRGAYHVRVCGKGGKRKLISTGCSDRASAVKVVDESGVADLQLAARAGRLTREAVGHITTGRRMTMDRSLIPYEEYMHTITLSPKTISNNLTSIRCWIREMKIGSLNPSSVTASHISKWVNNPESLSKRSTREVCLSCIRSLFSFMAANGWIVSDVSKLVGVDFSIMTHQQKESKVSQPFTDDEIETLLEYLDNNDEKFWHFAVMCSRENGLRISDIAQLERECFRQKPHTLSIWTGKTDKRLEHKMSPRLYSALMKIKPSDPKYLFPEHNFISRDVKKRASLSVQFSRICEGLGITGKSFHSVRHSASVGKMNENSESKLDLAKRLADVLDKKEISAMLGHSSTRTTDIYLNH